MSSISIAVQSEEFETITIELSSEEVTALYKLRKENQQRIAELEKKIESGESNLKYAQSSRDTAVSELAHAHTLLTALGVADKTDHEESYRRQDLNVTTRIALYIALKGN